jgi:taurine dioxygenase
MHLRSVAPENLDTSTIGVVPWTVNIGAEISGIDLSQPLSAEQLHEVSAVLAQYQVIFFRDQSISHDQHKAFGRLFGDLAIHSGVAGLADHPEIVAIHSDANSKYVAGENWHSDLTCDASPPMGSILYLKTVPKTGGDTVFASMYLAYEALSDRMKSYLEGMRAVHDGEHVYRHMTSDPNKRFPCNAHPIVRTHPVTRRKCLFVNASYVTHIEGVPKDESDAILGYLYKHCTNPNFQVRFRWTPNSVVFWDNRCTQHLAVWDYFPQTRSGYRVTVAGDKPV